MEDNNNMVSPKKWDKTKGLLLMTTILFGVTATIEGFVIAYRTGAMNPRLAVKAVKSKSGNVGGIPMPDTSPLARSASKTGGAPTLTTPGKAAPPAPPVNVVPAPTPPSPAPSIPPNPDPSDPFSGLDGLAKRMRKHFSNLFKGFGGSGQQLFSFKMGGDDVSLQVREKADEVIITGRIPGADASKFNIQIQDRNFTISGERSSGQGFFSMKTSFSQTLSLPADVDAARMITKYEKGVLTVRIPKR